jgi:hypothetical protein
MSIPCILIGNNLYCLNFSIANVIEIFKYHFLLSISQDLLSTVLMKMLGFASKIVGKGVTFNFWRKELREGGGRGGGAGNYLNAKQY